MSSSLPDELRTLYEAEKGSMLAVAIGLLHDRQRAEDAVHTAIASVLRRRFRPRELRPYVYRCIRNAAIDVLRRENRLEMSTHDEIPGSITVEPPLESTALVRSCLAQLEQQQREAVLLCAVAGLTAREAGAALKTSPNTIASRVRRGLERLRTLLEAPE